MTKQNERFGILLMIITTVVFASQDGLSKYLATEYNVYMVVMIRYWFFAAFVISISSQKSGGIRRVAKTKSPTSWYLYCAATAKCICKAEI